MGAAFKVLDWEKLVKLLAETQPDAYLQAGILEEWDSTCSIIWHPNYGFMEPLSRFRCTVDVNTGGKSPGIRFVNVDTGLIVSERPCYIIEENVINHSAPVWWTDGIAQAMMGLLVENSGHAKDPMWREYRRRLGLFKVRL